MADLVLPDILVLGKALTGGYIGHAVTVANHKVFDAFYSDDDRLALMHGPTFMGNPLACAVALKGIEIFERDDYMSKIRHIEQISRQEMENFSDPRIKEVRIMGGCTCVEVHDSKTLEGFQQFAYERGVFCRPFLNYMYSMVPYVISDGELIQIFDVMKDCFTETSPSVLLLFLFSQIFQNNLYFADCIFFGILIFLHIFVPGTVLWILAVVFKIIMFFQITSEITAQFFCSENIQMIAIIKAVFSQSIPNSSVIRLKSRYSAPFCSA